MVAIAGGTLGGAVAGRASTPDAVVTPNARSVVLDAAAAPAAPGATSSTADVSGLFETVRPSVVRIDAVTSIGRGTGTGFVISADGRIATNAHVVGDAANVEVEFADGTTEMATVLGVARSEDLAVIQVGRDDLTPVEFGSSDDLKVGERVVAIGNSLGFEGSPTATVGIVSALDRSIRIDDGTRLTELIQTDAAINPGNSGGPLFDLDGKVVGINSAGSPMAQSVGFAIAIDPAQPILDTLSAGEPVLQAFLGISSAPLTPETAAQLGVDSDGELRGALVLDVSDGSAAEAAGLLVGDLITAIDGDPVESPDGVGDAIGGRDPGDTIRITIVREGSEMSVDAVLGSRQA
jgi:putative serine protease PepD